MHTYIYLCITIQFQMNIMHIRVRLNYVIDLLYHFYFFIYLFLLFFVSIFSSFPYAQICIVNFHFIDISFIPHCSAIIFMCIFVLNN